MSNLILPCRKSAARVSARPTCVNLRERFGRRFKVVFEESYFAERPEFRAAEEFWLQIIPCEGGEIYPHGGDTLAACLRSGPRAERLKALACIRVKTVGDDGATVLFHVADFDQVATIMQPRKRRCLNLTPEQREAKRQRMSLINAARSQRRCEGQESTIGPQAEFRHQPAVFVQDQAACFS